MKLALMFLLLLTSAAFAADPTTTPKPAPDVQVATAVRQVPNATPMPAADLLKFASIGKPGPGTTRDSCDDCSNNPLDLFACLCCNFPYFCGNNVMGASAAPVSSCSKAPASK
jgi:hypothetical protein